MQEKPTYEELEQKVQRSAEECDRLRQMVKGLKESEQKFRSIFAHSPDYIYLTDIQGNILDANPALLEVLGLSLEELQKMNFAEFYAGDDLDHVLRSMLQLVEGKPVKGFQVRARTKSGNIFEYEVNAVPLMEDGKVTRVLSLARDITERAKAQRALRESEEMYKTLVKTCPDAVTVTDLEGNIVETSKRALEVFGFKSAEEVLGMSSFELFAPGQHEKALRNLEKTLREGFIRNVEYTFLKKDGTPFSGELNASVIKDAYGNPKTLIGSTRDITERKQADRELREYQEHLKERAEELEKAYEELKRLDGIKDSFLSSVSHELRTPLTSIRSFAEILVQYGDEDPETRKEFLNIIQLESERLTRLINDFLDLSKIEAGRMVFNEGLLCLEDIINDVAKSQHQLVRQRSLRLNLEIPGDLPLVLADRDRIQQVIMNLVANAIKFSSEGGEIRIRAESFEGKRSGETAAWICISVSDQGIGMEEKDLEVIFDKFSQISSDTLKEKPKGTGLGLPICREIISHYGGNIWVESQVGKGSTFFITLPASDTRIEQPQQRRLQTSGPDGREEKSALAAVDHSKECS